MSQHKTKNQHVPTQNRDRVYVIQHSHKDVIMMDRNEEIDDYDTSALLKNKSGSFNLSTQQSSSISTATTVTGIYDGVPSTQKFDNVSRVQNDNEESFDINSNELIDL